MTGAGACEPGRTYPISKDQCATVTLSGPLDGCRSLEPGYEEIDGPVPVFVAVEKRKARNALMNKDKIVWLIHWPVGTSGTGRRVLRLRHAGGVLTYFGPRTLDEDETLPFLEDRRSVCVKDMDSYEVKKLNLAQRRQLEEVAGKVGQKEELEYFPWVCDVLKAARKRGLFEREEVTNVLRAIEGEVQSSRH